MPCGSQPDAGPRFDVEVVPGGYAWWYLDGLSDDERHGLTVIAFVGSVFSPYYAAARRRGTADPLDHCALNVGLYGPAASRWAMTERGRKDVIRNADSLSLGSSSASWDGNGLTVIIDEWSVPWPRRIRGRLRLMPEAAPRRRFALDAAGRHSWAPLSPCARIEVDFEEPRLQWSGDGYLDMNLGAEPLEDAFAGWDWSRTTLPGGGTEVLYDLVERDGSHRALGLQFDLDNRVTVHDPQPVVALSRTRWGLPRSTRAAADQTVELVRTLEDTPFYARSLLGVRGAAGHGRAIHETLSLARFRSRWVQSLLPFRMPRRSMAGRFSQFSHTPDAD